LLCVDGGMALGQSNLQFRRWPAVLVFETVERQEIATFMKRVRRLPKKKSSLAIPRSGPGYAEVLKLRYDVERNSRNCDRLTQLLNSRGR